MKTRITSKEVIAELREIARKNGGFIAPKMVVDRARSEDSALHKSFDWDDSVAAEKWRLEQARNILQITVEYLPGQNNDRIPIRVAYSLTSDRGRGGYRLTTDIMSDEQLRDQMLNEALEELDSMKRKYGALRELSGVFAAARKVKRPKVR